MSKNYFRDPEIQEVLNSISPELSNVIKDLFEHDILNFPEHDEGNFDVDRLDYISRDSLYCGELLNFKTYPYKVISVEVDENGRIFELYEGEVFGNRRTNRNALKLFT